MVGSCSGLGVLVLVLAAGSSRRMGKANKLLLPILGKPMISHALDSASQCGAEKVYLLTGHERRDILKVAKPYSVEEIYNPHHCRGQNTSLALAAAELKELAKPVLVLPGDQPGVSIDLLRLLVQHHWEDGGRRALVPVFQGVWGTPRILPPYLLERMAEAGEQFSIRQLLSSARSDVNLVEVGDHAVVQDIDTPVDYENYLLKVAKS